MRVDMWSYYSVDRPPVKFHRIRSSFDPPTDNYRDIIVGQTSDVFGLRKQSPGLYLSSLLSALGFLHSPLPLTARPNLTSLISPRPSSHARPKAVPDPTRAVITVGFGSSPNTPKTSAIIFWPSLAFYLNRLISFGWSNSPLFHIYSPPLV